MYSQRLSGEVWTGVAQPMERENTDVGGVDLELGDLVAVKPWFGYRRSDGTAAPRTGTPEDRSAVTVQTVPSGRWGSDHVDRLLLTAPTAERDTSGLVPVASISEDEHGEQTAVSLRTDAPRFQERLDFRTPPPWNEGAGVALAAAAAVEKGHSLGLRHGALQPSDVVVAGSELAVAGMGLSLGGTPEAGLPMAPEVAQTGVPTVLGDVYSLGLLLQAGTAGDPTTPPEIAAIVADATAEDVEARIPSALAFAERLEDSGGAVMRSYNPMTFADSPLFATAIDDDAVAPIVVPPVVQSSSAITPAASQASRGAFSKALPWLVGGGLAAVIGFGLWAAATSGDGDSATTTTTAATSEPTTTVTTADSTSSTVTTDPSTTTTSGTTSTPSSTTTSSTTTTTSSPPTTVPTPPEVPAVPAADAGLEIVHGLSRPPVDAYLDGELLVGGFAPGEIAGPLGLTAGDYDLELFAATEDPAGTSAERTDDPLIRQTVPVTGDPAALVVASDGNDGVAILGFSDDLSPINPGEGRFSIRNPSSSTILVTLDPLTGGTALERQAISPGAFLSTDLPSGDYQLFISDESGSEILATVVSNTEGEATSATFLSDATPRLILQRIGDLGTPPDGIPTGTGGLLPGSEDPITGLLIAAAGAIGLFAVVGRERLRAGSR